jgi:hypothetical protein
MPDDLPTLRERLRQANADLAADLDVQWRIATTEWLPTVPLKQDSSNGLPHIRNIESHLDEVLRTLHRHNPSASVLHMQPIELYLLLASALFHDLGCADDSGHDHGDRSREFLVERYNSLGIRNREVARSLGGICASHTAKPDARVEVERELSLGDIVIDPYGEVRQRMIAALLTLADHMDCAQTRAVPDYLRTQKDVVGSFRSGIQGVFADPAARLVRTVLLSGAEQEGPRAERGLCFCVNDNADERRDWASKTERALGLTPRSLDALLRALLNSQELGLTRDRVNFLGEEWAPPGFAGRAAQQLGCTSQGSAFDFAEQMLAWNILRVKPRPKTWRRSTFVAMILGDLRANRAALYSVRDHLAAVGLPLATWLVDHEERLYTPDWRETYEPLFHKEYLVEVAEAMWDLSRRVVGVSEFTYAELASHIGDHDAAKVRMAARRLAIVMTTRRRTNDTNLPWSSPIWAGDVRWKWRANARDADQDRGCEFLSIVAVQRRVRTRAYGLSDPDDPREHRGLR